MMHPLKLFISKEGELKVKKRRILAAIILSIMFMLFATGCVVKEPVPEITEGRFDFSVTYEINGVEETYSEYMYVTTVVYTSHLLEGVECGTVILMALIVGVL
jgi:hypothetical protein